jgi:hypothetical protein
MVVGDFLLSGMQRRGSLAGNFVVQPGRLNIADGLTLVRSIERLPASFREEPIEVVWIIADRKLAGQLLFLREVAPDMSPGHFIGCTVQRRAEVMEGIPDGGAEVDRDGKLHPQSVDRLVRLLSGFGKDLVGGAP